MFTTPASTTVSSATRLLAKAALVAGLLSATVIVAPSGTASAGEAPAERPLTISTRCEGSLPMATISVHNAGLPELFFNVLENDVGILDYRLVARDGTQIESVEYPATGVGTEYSIETEEGYEVGRATLTDPEPDCTDDTIPDDTTPDDTAPDDTAPTDTTTPAPDPTDPQVTHVVVEAAPAVVVAATPSYTG